MKTTKTSTYTDSLRQTFQQPFREQIHTCSPQYFTITINNNLILQRISNTSRNTTHLWSSFW